MNHRIRFFLLLLGLPTFIYAADSTDGMDIGGYEHYLDLGMTPAIDQPANQNVATDESQVAGSRKRRFDNTADREAKANKRPRLTLHDLVKEGDKAGEFSGVLDSLFDGNDFYNLININLDEFKTILGLIKINRNTFLEQFCDRVAARLSKPTFSKKHVNELSLIDILQHILYKDFVIENCQAMNLYLFLIEGRVLGKYPEKFPNMTYKQIINVAYELCVKKCDHSCDLRNRLIRIYGKGMDRVHFPERDLKKAAELGDKASIEELAKDYFSAENYLEAIDLVTRAIYVLKIDIPHEVFRIYFDSIEKLYSSSSPSIPDLDYTTELLTKLELYQRDFPQYASVVTFLEYLIAVSFQGQSPASFELLYNAHISGNIAASWELARYYNNNQQIDLELDTLLYAYSLGHVDLLIALHEIFLRDQRLIARFPDEVLFKFSDKIFSKDPQAIVKHHRLLLNIYINKMEQVFASPQTPFSPAELKDIGSFIAKAQFHQDMLSRMEIGAKSQSSINNEYRVARLTIVKPDLLFFQKHGNAINHMRHNDRLAQAHFGMYQSLQGYTAQALATLKTVLDENEDDLAHDAAECFLLKIGLDSSDRNKTLLEATRQRPKLGLTRNLLMETLFQEMPYIPDAAFEQSKPWLETIDNSDARALVILAYYHGQIKKDYDTALSYWHKVPDNFPAKAFLFLTVFEDQRHLVKYNVCSNEESLLFYLVRDSESHKPSLELWGTICKNSQAFSGKSVPKLELSQAGRFYKSDVTQTRHEKLRKKLEKYRDRVRRYSLQNSLATVTGERRVVGDKSYQGAREVTNNFHISCAPSTDSQLKDVKKYVETKLRLAQLENAAGKTFELNLRRAFDDDHIIDYLDGFEKFYNDVPDTRWHEFGNYLINMAHSIARERNNADIETFVRQWFNQLTLLLNTDIKPYEKQMLRKRIYRLHDDMQKCLDLEPMILQIVEQGDACNQRALQILTMLEGSFRSQKNKDNFALQIALALSDLKLEIISKFKNRPDHRNFVEEERYYYVLLGPLLSLPSQEPSLSYPNECFQCMPLTYALLAFFADYTEDAIVDYLHKRFEKSFNLFQEFWENRKPYNEEKHGSKEEYPSKIASKFADEYFSQVSKDGIRKTLAALGYFTKLN